MVLQIIFIICALALIAYLVHGFLCKDHYVGYIGCILTTLGCVVCCFLILELKKPKTIHHIINLFLLFFTWFIHFLSVLLANLNLKRVFRFYKNPNFYIALGATGLIVYNMITGALFSTFRHIFLGSNWWVLNIDNASNPIAFNIFVVLILLSIAVIAYLLAFDFFTSTKMFRTRIVAGFPQTILMAALFALTLIYQLPLWIITLSMFIICSFLVYYAFHYTDSKLTRISIQTFANNFSEGFILFDHKDRRIYLNSLLSSYIPSNVLNFFENKANFQNWANQNEIIEGFSVKPILYEGRTVYLEIFEHPILDKGFSIGTFYSLKDMTDSIQHLQSMKLVNEELEATAKMKSDFLANMSHEIRTPMNAVIGMAEMSLREDLPDQAREYINQIKSSGHNLLNIINDILDFSKIESGKLDIIPAEYEPASEIHDIANTLVTRIGEKHIELILDVDPTLPQRLEGDSMRLRQVMINLANNAIKFTKEGFVHIDISYEKVSMDTIEISVHVKDSGMGIQPEDLKKLFVSFQQVDSKRNRNIEGTGLGLAISKKLIEAMGGTIGVTSEYGEGSDFYFTVPQKIVDYTPSMVLDAPDQTKVFGLFANPYIQDSFKKTIQALGASEELIDIDNDYIEVLEQSLTATTKEHSFLFFSEEYYERGIRELLDRHTHLTGVIFVNYDSMFISKQNNLRILRRPFTTLGISLILNNKKFDSSAQTDDAFSFNFTAPEAQVLIVDDNYVNLIVAKGLLEPLKMEIHTAVSGKEALQMVQNNTYDIIFMDHMMPEMDGLETTKHIREEIPSAKDTPIVALTANAISGAKELFLSNGMNDFVSKPIELKAIISSVKQWLPKNKIHKEEGLEPKTVDVMVESLDIPGLECAEALKLIGSVDLYHSIATTYYRSIDANYDEIALSFANEDWENYTIKVHALKSSSRQIGAKELSSMAEKLEAAGHTNNIEYIKQNTTMLLTTYRNIQELLSHYYQMEDEQVELKPIDHEFINNQLSLLSEACENLDMDAMEQVGKELSNFDYNEEQQEIIKELLIAIEAMDIDACEEFSGKLSKSL